jgi:hypothetical protein
MLNAVKHLYRILWMVLQQCGRDASLRGRQMSMTAIAGAKINYDFRVGYLIRTFFQYT